jgi:carboxylesterase type B
MALQLGYCVVTMMVSTVWSAKLGPVVDYPVVETSLGKMQGVSHKYDDKLLHTFQGIRYTDPMINEKRFLKSKVYEKKWKGVYNATSYGAVCIQNPAADPNMQGNPEAPPPNEDCLYLNIFTPAYLKNTTLKANLLPVMVWIHGGGLCIGDSSDAWQTGWDTIKDKNVILVNFNYRLGALGFMVSDSATRGGLPDSEFLGNGGMNGMHDQIVALQWVQREIEFFGGDPNQVTIFGESSGGSSVCTLSVAPMAKGLFHRSIIQSGPCIGGWGPLNVSFGQTVTRQILANHSVTSLKELQSPHIDPSTIQWPDYTMNDLTIAPYYSACFFDEGGLLPAYPVELYKSLDSRSDSGIKGQLNVDDFIIGTTSRDGTAIYYGTVPLLPNNQSLDKIYEEGLKFNWGEKAARVKKQYPLSQFNGSPQDALTAADGDAYVICPSRHIARLVSEKATRKDGSKVPTHVFMFSHWKSHNCDPAIAYLVLANHSSNPGWASHGTDVQYTFGTTFGGNWNHTEVFCPFTEEEEHLVADIETRWHNFAINGSVQTAVSEVQWPEFLANAPNASVYQFATHNEAGGSTVLVNDRMDRCDFWAKEMPSQY